MEVTDSNFGQEVIKKSEDIPVVVDFWAEWCMPCRMLGPTLEQMEKEFKGKFVLAKLNVDEAGGKAQEYGITNIPAVKMFKNGKVADEFIGAIPETEVSEWLNRNLKD